MTKAEEIEILRNKVKELEARPLERIIEKLKKDIEFLGVQVMAFGNENSKEHLKEIYNKWGLEF